MHKKSCKIEKNGKWYSKKKLNFFFLHLWIRRKKKKWHVLKQNLIFFSCIWAIPFEKISYGTNLGNQISFLKWYVLFVFVLFRFKPKWAKPFDEITWLHSITFLRLLTSTSKMGAFWILVWSNYCISCLFGDIW